MSGEENDVSMFRMVFLNLQHQFLLDVCFIEHCLFSVSSKICLEELITILTIYVN